MLGEHLSLIRLGEDGAHQGGHYGLGGLGHLGQQVAQEVYPAARPGGPCQGRLEPQMVVRDRQLHPGQPPLWAITTDAKFSPGLQAYVKA